MSMSTFAPAWPLEMIVEQAVAFHKSQGRWPRNVTRQGERQTFSDFLTECRQTGAAHNATSLSVALLGLNPGAHSVADVAAVIEADMRGRDVRNYKLDNADLEAIVEPMLKSLAVGGSVDSTVAIAGRAFPLADFLAAHEDSPLTLRTDLVQLLDIDPPCSVGRAVGIIRARMRDAARLRGGV